ncbi:MAG: cytochrome c [Candidatus Eisenbacteria bacterium]|nr:cytochrome c [Candidatus Eisenbacteria bacterium]
MNRYATCLLVSALVVLAGCGGKAEDQGSSSASASPAPAAGKLLAKSLYDDGPRAADSPVDAAAAAAGEKLFSTKGCTACHAWGRKLTGPDLKDVTKQRTATWMENQILHPDVMVKTDPIARALFAQFALQMPKQGLTETEAKQVVEYLKKRDKDGK